MKKLLFALFTLFFVGIASASTLDTSISRMYENGLTKFSNSTDFMATKPLRRDEAAKFFVQYVLNFKSDQTYAPNALCDSFTDLSKAHSDLTNVVKSSCKIGLFRGSQGKFMPDQSLTNGQAITVLMRMIDGMQDESQGHFARLYFQKATELNIMNGVNISVNTFDNLATRGDVAILLYNASQIKKEQTSITPIVQVDERFSQCKKVTGLPIDYSGFTGQLSGQFDYAFELFAWVNNSINLTKDVWECSTANNYLRDELANIEKLRRNIATAYKKELLDQIDTNRLYINAITDPHTTVLVEYNTCIDYNAKVAINNTLGADTTAYKNCGENPIDYAFDLSVWNQRALAELRIVDQYD